MTIGELTDGRVAFNNSSMARVLEVGSSWTELRLGLLYHLADSGANLVQGPRIIAGIMPTPTAGIMNGPLNVGSVQSYYGVWHDRSGSPTWTRTAGPPAYYSGQIYFGRVIGSTFTQQAFINGIKHSAVNTIRKPLMLRFKKNSGTMEMTAYASATWTADNCTEAQVQATLELATWGTASNLNATLGLTMSSTGLSNYPTYDEGANGALNTVVIGWDREYPTLSCCGVWFGLGY